MEYECALLSLVSSKTKKQEQKMTIVFSMLESLLQLPHSISIIPSLYYGYMSALLFFSRLSTLICCCRFSDSSFLFPFPFFPSLSLSPF